METGEPPAITVMRWLDDHAQPKAIRLWTIIKYRIVQTVWNTGQRLKEWACIKQGGTHDLLPNGTTCVVCGKKISREILVIGSNGQFTVNESGYPIGPLPTEYMYIRRLDLEEWKTFWNQKEVAETLDILDVGGWKEVHELSEDEYFPAEPSWRREAKESMLPRGAMRAI